LRHVDRGLAIDKGQIDGSAKGTGDGDGYRDIACSGRRALRATHVVLLLANQLQETRYAIQCESG
jgi:hypothetical protein